MCFGVASPNHLAWSLCGRPVWPLQLIPGFGPAPPRHLFVLLIFKLFSQLIFLGGGVLWLLPPWLLFLPWPVPLFLLPQPFCILQGNAYNQGKGLQRRISHHPGYPSYTCGTDNPVGVSVPPGVEVCLGTYP